MHLLGCRQVDEPGDFQRGRPVLTGGPGSVPLVGAAEVNQCDGLRWHMVSLPSGPCGVTVRRDTPVTNREQAFNPKRLRQWKHAKHYGGRHERNAHQSRVDPG